MLKAHFCLPLEAHVLCANNLFKTENAILLFKGEKVLYAFYDTLAKEKA